MIFISKANAGWLEVATWSLSGGDSCWAQGFGPGMASAVDRDVAGERQCLLRADFLSLRMRTDSSDLQEVL